MGKNFNKDNNDKGRQVGKNATSRGIKRNVSKKEADSKRKVVDYTKAVARNAKVAMKKNEWEMRRQAKRKVADFKRPAGLDRNKKAGDEWEDVDEHEKDVFDKDGYFDVMDTEAMISANDQKILEQFGGEDKPAKVSEGKSMADLIMQKLSAGDF